MRCASCPVAGDEGLACLGETVPRLCELARTRADYRRELRRLARPRGDAAADAPTPAAAVEEVLGRVARCPDRGATLPASWQAECGCFERVECRAGRGTPPDAVTLQDCLACVTAAGR